MVSVWAGLAGGQTNSKAGWGAGRDGGLGEGNRSAFSPSPGWGSLTRCPRAVACASRARLYSGHSGARRAGGQVQSAPALQTLGPGHRRRRRGPPCCAAPTRARLLRGLRCGASSRTPAAWPWGRGGGLEAAPRPGERRQEQAGQASAKARLGHRATDVSTHGSWSQTCSHFRATWGLVGGPLGARGLGLGTVRWGRGAGDTRDPQASRRGKGKGSQDEHTETAVLDAEAQGGRPAQAMPRGGAGAARGRRPGASRLTGGQHGGFTPNLLQLLNEQGIHLPLQGPCLPAGTLGPARDHLRAAQATGVRGHGAAAARTLPSGPSASPRTGAGSPQRVRPGAGLLADGLVRGCGPQAGQLPPPQALRVLSSAGAHHTLHAGGGHPSRPGALRGTRGLLLGQTPLRRAPPHRRLTSGAAGLLGG